ncbi:MAG: hypothetical protein ILO68_06365, partial [Clostridia bacterium]|nr:hypothetical protein [Clostridia bacterium]
MNKIFNGRLYLEGIKKIRVLGIAFSIVIIVLNALVPLTHFLIAFVQAAESGFKEGIIATVVSAEYFAVPTTLLMFFTPFFIFTIFAYLNSRAESDFYHAIPYTRASVYLSFTAAAYTWIFGILIASTSLTTLLWTINPYASFTLSTPLFVLAEYAVATLFIGAISSVAACLTGTKASQFFVTMILLFFLRITATAFVLCVQGLAPVLDINNSLLMLLSPSNYFPLSVFSNLFYGDVLSTPAPWIYALCVSAAGFAVSGVLYVKRRSETAGKSAPNKVFQHIFRCLFVLPWVAAIGALILFEAHIAFIFVLCNIALVVYFLYELITTKSAKAMLKAAPFLAVLLVVGLLFVGGAHLAKNIILSQTYTPEQIDSVGMSKENG